MKSTRKTNTHNARRATRTVALVLSILVAATASTAVTPARAEAAASDSQGSYAEATYACALSGLVLYQGIGFQQIRLSTYVHGRGHLTDSWRPFQRNWDESPSFLVPRFAPRGSTYAILAQYRTWNPVTRSWRYASEWLVNERGTYWCRA